MDSDERDDDYHLYLYCSGIESIKNGQWETAYDQLSQSLAMDPHSKTCERLAFVLERLGQPEAAMKMLEKAFELNPKADVTAYRYAEMLFRSGRIEQSRSVLAGILERNATYGPAKRLMGELERE